MNTARHVIKRVLNPALVSGDEWHPMMWRALALCISPYCAVKLRTAASVKRRVCAIQVRTGVQPARAGQTALVRGC